MPLLFALVSLLVKAGRGGGKLPSPRCTAIYLEWETSTDSSAKQGLQQPRAIMKVKSTLIMCLCSACHPRRFLSPGRSGALLPVFQPSGMT